MKSSGSNRNRRRALLRVAIIVAAAIVAVIVGILILAKGIESTLPAIFSGSAFAVVLVLYWLRSEKEGANADGYDE